MLSTMIARTATAALVGGLLVVAGPGQADADRASDSWGKVSSKNHTLQRGCHRYTYRYEITAPTDDWSAEVFIIGPDGTGLASGIIDTNADPDRGKKKYKLCSPSTTVGRHKIRMKVTYNPGPRMVADGYVKPAKFRFTRR